MQKYQKYLCAIFLLCLKTSYIATSTPRTRSSSTNNNNKQNQLSLNDLDKQIRNEEKRNLELQSLGFSAITVVSTGLATLSNKPLMQIAASAIAASSARQAYTLQTQAQQIEVTDTTTEIKDPALHRAQQQTKVTQAYLYGNGAAACLATLIGTKGENPVLNVVVGATGGLLAQEAIKTYIQSH